MSRFGKDLIQAMGEALAHANARALPPLRSDAEAEAFVETADLTEYDLSGFKPMSFEIDPEQRR